MGDETINMIINNKEILFIAGIAAYFYRELKNATNKIIDRNSQDTRDVRKKLEILYKIDSKTNDLPEIKKNIKTVFKNEATLKEIEKKINNIDSHINQLNEITGSHENTLNELKKTG